MGVPDGNTVNVKLSLAGSKIAGSVLTAMSQPLSMSDPWMFTDTVNSWPFFPENVGGDGGHDVELPESMQTVPTMVALVG